MTNEHVVERAADLKIEVITNDTKSYKARYITGDPKKDLAFIKIDSDKPLPFVNLHDISPNLLGQTVIVVGNALGYGSSISRGVLSGVKREITVDNIDYHDFGRLPFSTLQYYYVPLAKETLPFELAVYLLMVCP